MLALHVRCAHLMIDEYLADCFHDHSGHHRVPFVHCYAGERPAVDRPADLVCYLDPTADCQVRSIDWRSIDQQVLHPVRFV